MKKLLLYFLFLSSTALAQSPFYHDIVRANTLSPARVANALDISKPLASSGTDIYAFSAPFTGFAYHTGDIYTFVFVNANTSTTVTANIATLGALAIKDASGADLGVGDLKAGGAYKFYNNGTHLRLIGGGGGTPGGSNTQVQYNNAGAFGGITGATTNGTTLTLVAPVLGTPASGVGTNITGILGTNVINSPAGSLAADDVQEAINELDSEKVTSVSGDGVNNADPLNPVLTYPTPGAINAKPDKEVFVRYTGSHTLDASDFGKVIEMNVASANDLTIPPNSSVAFAIGTYLSITQYGAGTVTVQPGSGVTRRSSSGVYTTPSRYSVIGLLKVGTDEWYVFNGTPVADWQVWSSLAPTGFSATTLTNSYYMTDGKTVWMTVEIKGTSNATTFTFTLPFALSSTVYSSTGFKYLAQIASNGTFATGIIDGAGGSTTVTVYATPAGAAFSSSNQKELRVSFTYAR